MRKTILNIEANKQGGALLITAEVKNKVAYISIDGYIHAWGEASSKKLKNEIATLKSEGAPKAEVTINTEGGSCFEANEMANTLLDEYGVENVTMKAGALVASAGTYILAVFNSNAIGRKNSQFMIHKPSGSFFGPASKVRNDLKLLDNLEQEYRSTYAQAFGKTEEEIDALWDKGDHWMTAKEAKKLGLIATIDNEEVAIDASMRLQLVAAAAPIIPSNTQEPNKNQKKDTQMDKKVLAVKLGLPEDANEEQINAKLAEVQAKAATAETLQQKIDQNTATAAATEMKAFLDKAEADKKITGEVRATYEELFKASPEACKKAIEALQPVTKIPLIPGAQNPGVSSAAAGEYQSYEDYAKAGKKGADAWAALEESDPKKAEALMEAHIADS